jgi:hypothetical protein
MSRDVREVDEVEVTAAEDTLAEFITSVEQLRVVRESWGKLHVRATDHVKALQQSMNERINMLRQLFVIGSETASVIEEAVLAAQAQQKLLREREEQEALQEQQRKEAAEDDEADSAKPAPSPPVAEGAPSASSTAATKKASLAPADVKKKSSYAAPEEPMHHTVTAAAPPVEYVEPQTIPALADEFSLGARTRLLVDDLSMLSATSKVFSFEKAMREMPVERQEVSPAIFPLAKTPELVSTQAVIRFLGQKFALTQTREVAYYRDGRPIVRVLGGDELCAPYQGPAATLYVETKRGTVYVLDNSPWILPGQTVVIRQLSDTRRFDDIAVVLMTWSQLAATGMALTGASLPRALLGRIYKFARVATPGDQENHQSLRTSEQMAQTVCNAKALDWHLPIFFTDVDYSYDRGHILLTYTCHVYFDWVPLMEEISSLLRVRVAARPAQGSLDLSDRALAVASLRKGAS